MLAVPVFGGLMYLFYGGNKIGKRARRKMLRQEECVRIFMGHSRPEVRAVLEEQGGAASTQARYLEDASFCPPHIRTETSYFPLGDDMFVKMKEELEKARALTSSWNSSSSRPGHDVERDPGDPGAEGGPGGAWTCG